jgi:recombination protein RecR
MNGFHSSYLEKAVDELSKLPGIGKKTALRLILHLLKQDETFALSLSEALKDVRTQTKRCKVCHNISDDDICPVCANSARNHKQICIVEDIGSLMSIENTGKYNGVYHVLEGKLSPMENIGPEKLTIDSLVLRVEQDKPDEVIFALGTTLEADVTTLYIYDLLKNYEGIKFSTIARGISFGDDIEDADSVTLGKSIELRTEFEPQTSE